VKIIEINVDNWYINVILMLCQRLLTYITEGGYKDEGKSI